ncbi:hypothetical protein Chor_008557, partial [Crotalus horridus]
PSPYFEPTIPASHFISYGNSSYSMVSPKMTWEEARKKCESENSKLASIVDPYAESFVWLQVLKYKEPVWIGLSSKESNGVYKWVSNWRVVYTNWAAEEPMHKTACVYLGIDGYWKTGNCSEKYFSVCERYNGKKSICFITGVVPTEIPQLPGKCQTSKNSRISWIPFRGHCYKLYISGEIWPAASLKCIQIGEWIWQDKSKVAFVNWNDQEFSNSLQFDSEEDDFSEKCTYINSYSGLWSIGYCGGYQRRPFICKKNKSKHYYYHHSWYTVNHAQYLYTENILVNFLVIEESTIKPTKISVQKGVAPQTAHGTAVVVVVPIIFIAIGAGIAAYIFYRRRNRPQQVSAGFDNSLYSDNVVILHKDSLVDNQELN